MAMSCFTSSYFSSIDNAVPPQILVGGYVGRARSVSADPCVIEPLQKIFLALPERVDFVVVAGRAGFLQPVDFALHVGPLAVEPARFRVRTQSAASPGAPVCRAISCTNAASPLVRRSMRASGKDPAGHSCRDRACRRISRPPARPDRPLPARAGPHSAAVRLVHQGPNQAAFRRLSPAPGAAPGAGPPSTLVCRWTAALRISARTTSSVIRALCDSLSANWSRCGGVGNPRRHRQHLRQERPPPLIR